MSDWNQLLELWDWNVKERVRLEDRICEDVLGRARGLPQLPVGSGPRKRRTESRAG